MFVRIVLALFAVVIVIMAMRYLRNAVAGSRKPPAIDAPTARCAYCQVYFPRNEATEARGRVYCSAAHAERDDH